MREIIRVSGKLLRQKRSLGLSVNDVNLKLSQRSFSEFARSLLLSEISKTNIRETNRRKDLASFNQLIPDIVHILTLTNKRHFEFEDANKWFGKVLQSFMTSTNKEAGLLVLNSSAEPLFRSGGLLTYFINNFQLKTSLDLTNKKWDTLSYAFIHRNYPSPDFLKDSDKYYDAGRLLESALYNLLKQAFQNEYYYIDVIQQFHDVSHRAMMGKVLQNHTECERNYDNFTMDRYAQIVKYGTAYHFFKLPVSLALYMFRLIILSPECERNYDNFTMDRYAQIVKYGTAYHFFKLPVSLALYMTVLQHVCLLITLENHVSLVLDVDSYPVVRNTNKLDNMIDSVRLSLLTLLPTSVDSSAACMSVNNFRKSCLLVLLVSLNATASLKILLRKESFSEFARSLLLSEISKTNIRETNRRKDLASFNQLIPDIVHILTLTNKRHFEFEDANKWFGKVLQSFMTSTNKEAGLLVLNSFNLLADPDEKHDDSVIKKAQIMGWCVEMYLLKLQKKSYQFSFFQKSYGIEDAAAIEEIKSLYTELNIPSTFKQYENQCYDMLHTQIQQSSRGLPHRLFYQILEKWIPYKT
ncbi:uncharacterized protein LOC103505835 [Diaphorina citri]|uniref:Uncharacterized protein LOC103505835 n=1 Tax=Diaphorina citri TaxID=121845 RepID=A0A1S3CWG7_DIACI|nr:uncharacterized protein LOC103505835 [Diaphorina citri]